MNHLPFWEEKCWGVVMHCFHNDQASVSYLEVEKGWRCSNHWHEQRANTFIVISGEIAVIQYPVPFEIGSPDASFHKAILLPGSSFTVPSTYVHRFEVVESGSLIEVYYPDRGGKVDIEDIHRLDVGGRISNGS